MVTFIVVLLIVGLITGAIARLLVPGRDHIGILARSCSASRDHSWAASCRVWSSTTPCPCISSTLPASSAPSLARSSSLSGCGRTWPARQESRGCPSRAATLFGLLGYQDPNLD